MIRIQFKDPIDAFIKRVKFGEMNERFKRQIVSSDVSKHTLPFLCNPFRSSKEQASWPGRDELEYEYTSDHSEQPYAKAAFDIAWRWLEKRIPKTASIYDIGCSTGYFLSLFHDKGFANLHGLDPQKMAVDYVRKERPFIDMHEGFFADPAQDVKCDLLTFFQTIYRVPYEQNLFDAIDRCAKKYVHVGWTEDGTNLFVRDLHVNMAKIGFICIEKTVLDSNHQPYGSNGGDEQMLEFTPTGDLEPNYTCHYLFRRIKPHV